jgi:hypothetical protein
MGKEQDRQIVRVLGSMMANRALTPRKSSFFEEEEEGLKGSRRRESQRGSEPKELLKNVGIGWFALLFFASCLIRYFMEVLSNMVVNSFKEQANWEKLFRDSDCGADSGKGKILCRAIQLCMQEVVPELVPASPDDIWIQILIVVIIYLLADKIDSEASSRKQE